MSSCCFGCFWLLTLSAVVNEALFPYLVHSPPPSKLGFDMCSDSELCLDGHSVNVFESVVFGK